MRWSSSSRAAAAMVMTIGELHAGHCIDPSLAHAVRWTQRNPLFRTSPYPGSAGTAGVQSLVKRAHKELSAGPRPVGMGNGSRCRAVRRNGSAAAARRVPNWQPPNATAGPRTCGMVSHTTDQGLDAEPWACAVSGRIEGCKTQHGLYRRLTSPTCTDSAT